MDGKLPMLPIPPARGQAPRAPQRRSLLDDRKDEKKKTSAPYHPKPPVAGAIRARPREALEALDTATVGLEAIERREGAGRRAVLEDEEWVFLRIWRQYLFAHEEEVLIPLRARIVEHSEPSARKQVMKAEGRQRSSLVADLKEGLEKLQYIRQHLQSTILLETAHRHTIIDNWKATLMGNVEVLREISAQAVQKSKARAASANARIARDIWKHTEEAQRAEREHLAKLTLEKEQAAKDVVLKLEDSEFDARVTISACENDERVRLLLAERRAAEVAAQTASLRDQLDTDEVERREAVAEEGMASLALLIAAAEELQRLVACQEEEKEWTTYMNQHDATVACIANWYDHISNVRTLQWWWRRVRRCEVGRSCNNQYFRAWAGQHRHKKEVERHREQLRWERQRCAEELLEAEKEYAGVYTLGARLAAVESNEEKGRQHIAEDEGWQVRELWRDFQFVLVVEILTPARRELVGHHEPRRREELENEETDLRAHALKYHHSAMAVMSAKWSLVHSEQSSRIRVQFDAEAARNVLRVEEAEDLEFIRVSAEQRRIRAEQEAAEYEAKKARRCIELEETEFFTRGQVELAEGAARCDVLETLSRTLHMADERAAAVSLVSAEELLCRIAVQHLEAYAKGVLIGERENVYRQSIEVKERAGRARVGSGLRCALNAYFISLEQREPQVRKIQDFVRRVKKGTVGRRATRFLIRRDLTRIREQRAINAKRAEAHRQVEEQRAELAEEEARLVEEEEERIKEAFRRVLERERRGRDDTATEALWFFSCSFSQFSYEAEEILRHDFRRCHQRQEYWRTRIGEEEEDERKKLIDAQREGRLHLAPQPFQRAYRCRLARKKYAALLARQLVLVTERHEPRDRAAIEYDVVAQAVELLELRDRSLLLLRECSENLTLTAEAEDSWRVAHEARVERAFRGYLEEYATSCLASLAAGEGESWEDLMRSEQQEGSANRLQHDEERGRREVVQEMITSVVLVAKFQEGEQRCLVARDEVHSREASKLLELAERGGQSLLAELPAVYTGLVEAEEGLWRAELEAERTADYRRLYVLHLEDEGRLQLENAGWESLLYLKEEQEYDARGVLEAARDWGVRSLYRQRLEGTLRRRIHTEWSTAVVRVMELIEEGERAICAADEVRWREWFELQLVHEPASRAVVTDEAAVGYLQVLEAKEELERMRIEAHAIPILTELTESSRNSSHRILSLVEEDHRVKIGEEEAVWRKRIGMAEGSQRLHVVVLPIQRQCRVKLGRLAVRRGAERLLSEHEHGRAGVAMEEGCDRLRLAEMSLRGQLSTEELVSWDAITLLEADARCQTYMKTSHREEREELVYEAELMCAVEMVRLQNEARAEIVVEQALHGRRVLEAEAWTGWLRTLEELEGIERRRQKDGREAAYSEIVGSEWLQRVAFELAEEYQEAHNATMKEEETARGEVESAITWLIESPHEVFKEEFAMRHHITDTEDEAHRLLCTMERGEREHILHYANAALKIQLAWRRYMAVNLVEVLQAIRIEDLAMAEAEHREHCAVQLQARWKGYAVREAGVLDMLRKEYDDKRKAIEAKERDDHASRILQRYFLQRTKHSYKKIIATREAAELRRQREEIADMREFVEELNYYARMIQATYRMYRVRRKLVEKTFSGDWA